VSDLARFLFIRRRSPSGHDADRTVIEAVGPFDVHEQEGRSGGTILRGKVVPRVRYAILSAGKHTVLVTRR